MAACYAHIIIHCHQPDVQGGYTTNKYLSNHFVATGLKAVSHPAETPAWQVVPVLRSACFDFLCCVQNATFGYIEHYDCAGGSHLQVAGPP